MIADIERVKSALSDLLAYYGRPANQTAIAVWMGHICERMEDQEFFEAVDRCFLKCDRLPTIEAFIALVQGTDQARLEELDDSNAWIEILRGVTIASSRDPEHTAAREAIVYSLSDAQRYALRSLGGLFALGEGSNADLGWKRKDFMGLCQSFRRGHEQLEIQEQAGRKRLERQYQQPGLSGISIDNLKEFLG